MGSMGGAVKRHCKQRMTFCGAVADTPKADVVPTQVTRVVGSERQEDIEEYGQLGEGARGVVLEAASWLLAKFGVGVAMVQNIGNPVHVAGCVVLVTWVGPAKDKRS